MSSDAESGNVWEPDTAEVRRGFVNSLLNMDHDVPTRDEAVEAFDAWLEEIKEEAYWEGFANGSDTVYPL